MAHDKERRRSSQTTKEAILNAARRTFIEKGFDAAGLREITAAAGVNAALVNRYFGSKENLFRKAVVPELNIDALLAGDRETFGKRAATFFARSDVAGEDTDPTLAFIRSAGSAYVNKTVSKAIHRQIVLPLAEWLGGEDAEQRAALIVAHMTGFETLRRVVGLDSLSQDHAETVILRFARVLQSYVDDKH
ncbi:TetR family transcriptional regulator [Hoeflea prorocentri]|uniref:TetR family transcriptional regulator n=1 Tax=Hoeflea prorocentri TaxID=1922333 RepID=A0A9X3UP44_9HYPH|nr:TetR family transcriptional regulator [Hoeflea prorocentri]MCY6382819.1 TetR family transcriptional regulator [Hoeflea prorocentri]MDA5400619.1 TetR family transcriptional regulator [Hoeflea prorocentri]